MKRKTVDQATRDELADYLTLLDQDDTNRFVGWVCSALSKAPGKSLAELTIEFREYRTRRILEGAGLPHGRAPKAAKAAL